MKRRQRPSRIFSLKGAAFLAILALAIFTLATLASCQPWLAIDTYSEGRWNGPLLTFKMNWDWDGGYRLSEFTLDSNWYAPELGYWELEEEVFVDGSGFSLQCILPETEEGGGKEILLIGKFVTARSCVGSVLYDGVEETWTAVSGPYVY